MRIWALPIARLFAGLFSFCCSKLQPWTEFKGGTGGRNIFCTPNFFLPKYIAFINMQSHI